MGKSFFIPQTRYVALPRPRIIDRALESDPAIIAILGAPGTGKAVAAVQIAMAFADAHEAHLVWFNTTLGDSQPETFWERLFFTLTQTGMFPEPSLAQQLSKGGVASLEQCDALVRALTELRTPLVLVLDDLHMVESSKLQESILTVVEQTPALWCVVTSRSRMESLTGAGPIG